MSDEETPPTDILQVKILGPTSTLFDGEAVSISAHNKRGQFDVLVGHQNFFSLLDECQIVVSTRDQQNLTFPIYQGLIKVKSNIVKLFVDIDPSYQPHSYH